MGSNASVLQWRCKTCTYSLNPTERSTCCSCGQRRQTDVERLVQSSCSSGSPSNGSTRQPTDPSVADTSDNLSDDNSGLHFEDNHFGGGVGHSSQEDSPIDR